MARTALFQLFIGEIYLTLGSYDQALAAFEKANSLYANSPYAAKRLSAARKQKADSGPEADLERLQGKWERVMAKERSLPGEVARVKEIKGNKETVTWYDAKGAVLRSHRVTISLARTGNVKTFTFSEMEILHGPQKGQKVNVTGSYIYLLDKDTYYEGGGFLPGQTGPAGLEIYKRVGQK